MEKNDGMTLMRQGDMAMGCVIRMTEGEALIWPMCKVEEPSTPPSSELLRKIIGARHSPIRVLNYAFLIEGIPSNISTHLARHVHAVPFISSLRNDRQGRIDGDAARRDTPVNMIYYLNAEELCVVANKRLCNRASEKTREAVRLICEEAAKATPEIKEWLVPMCEYGRCHEIEPCGRAQK